MAKFSSETIGGLFVIPRTFRRTTIAITWSIARHQQYWAGTPFAVVITGHIEPDNDVSETVRLRWIVHRLMNERLREKGHVTVRAGIAWAFPP
ncbi:MAG TPA: hypothetical protein VF088_05985 [Pyrinomonadaceae bacterium]